MTIAATPHASPSGDVRVFRRLAIVTALFTYALIVMGAVVRVTGSGLGCPDWPTCHGSLIPPPDPAAWIEWTHRTIAAVTTPLILATTAAAWVWHRAERGVLAFATLLPVVLGVQVALGAVVVLLELETIAVLVHLTFALAILGALVWIAGLAGEAPRTLTRPTPVDGGFLPLVAATTLAIAGLIVAGGYVRATGASWACQGFPDCNGRGLLPFGQTSLMDIQLIHRLLAYFATAMVAWLVLETRRTQHHVPALQTAVLLLGASIVVQAGIGAVAVTSAVPPLLQALHVAGAAATWSAMVVVASLAFRTRPTAGETALAAASSTLISHVSPRAAAARQGPARF